ncbi:MAG: hypothetical protein GXP55_16410 [Deltaproteobacteria bacterium]|nr:hypothetical protein [Deltaproteobacteria bacterium]
MSDLPFAREAGALQDAPAWGQGEGVQAKPWVFPVVAGADTAPVVERRQPRAAPPPAQGSESSELSASEATPSRPSRPPASGESPGYSQPPAVAAAPTEAVPPESFLSREAELTLMLEQRIEAFAEAAVELGALRARALATAEAQLVDLALCLAAAIVEREVEQDPELHLAMARAALRTLGDADRARLRVSPAAHAAIEEVFEDARVEYDGVRVELESDATLDGLGCIADSPRAQVDARLPERIRAARRAVEEERRRESLEESE